MRRKEPGQNKAMHFFFNDSERVNELEVWQIKVKQEPDRPLVPALLSFLDGAKRVF